jgi:uncharacterized protein (DUF3084 family)
VAVLGRKVDNEDPVAAERRALAEQRDALEDLKRELAARVAAVQERENELRAAMTAIAAGKESTVLLPAVGDPNADRLAARAAALAERERALALREAGAANGSGEQVSAARMAAINERETSLAARETELDARERAVAERERIPADPDAVRLEQIETRLNELRAAEAAFLRTRRDLAEHSDAITAREQLLAQRERELDEREDSWGGPEIRDLESRLRRLETQRLTGEPTRSFSGGFRKLEEEGTRKPQG